MNATKPWKKTEEIEINLLDLLKKLCTQWKQIAICAVVFACLLGGYQMISNKSATKKTKGNVSETIQLTDFERENVNAAVALKKENDSIKKYLDESIAMNIDPYHKNQVVLLYSIDGASKRARQKIVESYLNFVSSGGMIEALQKSGGEKWNIDQTYLAELISANQKTDDFYQIVIDDLAAESLFYVQAVGKDEEMAENLAADMQEALNNYYSTVKETSGEHTLTLLDSRKSIRYDAGLATQQHDKRTLLSTNNTSLKTMTDAFSDEQKIVYEEAAGEEENQVKSTGISKKYILLGFVGGIFVYCCIFACFYLLRDTIKSIEELKDYYNFPFYGGILLKKGTKGSGEDLSGNEHDLYDREKAQMLNRIKLACKKQEISKLCLATDFSISEQEKAYLDGVSKQLKEWGIDTILGENIGGNISMWDTLTKAGNVLMIYKIGTTTHQMIDEEMNFYLENDISVIGAVALENK